MRVLSKIIRRHFTALLFAVLLTSCGIYMLVVTHKISESQIARKRGADAFCIRDALFKYMERNSGKMPLSLRDLDYSRLDVDTSAFRLLENEIDPNDSNRRRLVEGVFLQNGYPKKVYIYSDSNVEWK